MTEIVLVRHGQASFGKANYDKLSDLGEQQSIELGRFFAQNNFTFDALWRGDMFRHEETALGILSGLHSTDNGKQIAQSLGEVSVKPGMNEFDFQTIADAYVSDYPDEKPPVGAKPAEFYRLLRKSMLAWSQGVLDKHDLPERWDTFTHRVMQTLEEAATSGHKRIVIATSGGAIAMAVSQVVNADSATMINLNLQIRNTSLTHFFVNKSGRHLHQFNAVPHLEVPHLRHAISYS